MDDLLVPGTRLGDHYTIDKVLGRGGMGVVYRVTDHTMQNTPLALKSVLPRFFENNMALERFEQEIGTLRQFDHPNIVRVYDTGILGKSAFFTMEYVRGKSLRKWLVQKRRLRYDTTLKVLLQLCDALVTVHEVTVHRDLSPENIMALSSGRIKVLDFGLAKIAEEETQKKMRMGKVNYSSPEQRRDARRADPRADIYSVGVMFYEMLTGKLPLISKRPTLRITDELPELPESTNEFLRKTLAELPDDRYPSARGAGKALFGMYEDLKKQFEAREASGEAQR